MAEPAAHFSYPKHRAHHADPADFDVLSAAPFHLLTSLGLRDYHFTLDIGCGALGLARLLIAYLHPERYFGIELEQRLLEEGVRHELGHDQLSLKRPRFLVRPDYHLTDFGLRFDYMVAHSVFSYAAQPQIRTCFEQVTKCLRPHGMLAASWMQELEFSELGMVGMAAEAGLHCKVLDWPHPAGETWAIFHLPGAVTPEDPAYLYRTPLLHLSELRVVSQTNPGFIESVVEVGGSILVQGWAIHPGTGQPATHVLFADKEGRILASVRANLPRSDVAAVHGAKALRSGFRARLKGSRSTFASLVCLSFTLGADEAFKLPLA